MILIVGGAYQGKEAWAKAQFGTDYKRINAYHQLVKEQLQAGKDPMEEAKRLLEEETQQLVIISDETGCGLVPMDAFERAWREASGRVNCYFAQQAQQVYRVICGIGERIK